MNTPLGSPLATKPEKDAFHVAMVRIAETYNVTDLWLARRKVQQAVKTLYSSYQSCRSIVATRKGIEGINKHREIL